MLALLALASSAVWGTADFFGGLFTKRIAAVRVVAISQVGGLIAITIALLISLRGGSLSFEGWVVPAVAAGVIGAIGLSCFYAALSQGTMGVVSPIAALGVLVPVVLGIAGGDHLGGLTVVGMVLAIAGAALASGPELSGAAARRPVLLAVVAAFGFGLALYLLDRASEHNVVASLWGMRVGSVTMLGLVILGLRTRGGPSGGRARRRDLPGLLVVGTGDLAANALFAVASTRGYVSVASVLGSLYPVATLVWARFVLHERLRPIQAAGVGLAVVGVVLIAV